MHTPKPSTETKHTPGPWTVRPNNAYGLNRYTVEIGDARIDTPNKANAALIAAAPELLEALEAYINVPVLPDPGHEKQLIDAIKGP